MTPADTPPAVTATMLRRIELTVARRVEGLLHGDYRGLLPGPGSEAGDARPYEPGDDVRRIDWNVTARASAPHVRDTVADRELETWLCLDRSASLDFGTAAHTKADLALQVTATMGLLAARRGNRLGAVITSPDGVDQVPARTGRAHLMALLHRAARTPSSTRRGGAADLAAGIRRLATTPRRRGLAVVISDLLGDSAWNAELGRVARRHDLLVIEVVDPRELELPPVGLLRVVDPETGRQREVNTARRAVRQRYADAARRQRAHHAEEVRRVGGEHLQVRTDRDWLLDLAHFAARRRHRAGAPPRRART